MRKNHFAVACLSILFIFLFPSMVISAQQVRCTGQIVDARNQPITGAKVTAYEMHSDGIAGNILLRQVGEVTTTEDGAFIFTAELKPERGTFLESYIVAVKPDLALGWAVWSMREDAEVNIKLGKPERLVGVIADEAGEPIADAQVLANLYHTIKNAGGEEQRQWLPGIDPLDELGRLTDRQGRFSFNNIPAEVNVDLLVTAPGKAILYTRQSAPP